jgi:rubrerythrin
MTMSRMYFHADEILNMAEEIERNGAKFYRRAAEFCQDKRVQTLLVGLAEMEDEHLRTFGAMREQLSGREKVDPPENLEAALYLRAWADGHVFDTSVDPAEQLTGQETPVELLQRALTMERDSIAFYVGIKDVVPVGWGKDVVDAVIREEMRHVTDLTQHLERVIAA